MACLRDDHFLLRTFHRPLVVHVAVESATERIHGPRIPRRQLGIERLSHFCSNGITVGLHHFRLVFHRRRFHR